MSETGARACRAKISVVMRTHQQAETLGEAVESVLRQSRLPDELVVVDDGSTDGTAALLASMTAQHQVIRVIRHATPLGPARAFNAGAYAAVGDMILPVDGDDRISPELIERCERALESTGADIAFPGARLFGAADEWWPPSVVDAEQMRVENPLHVSCMFRRWILDRVGGFDPGFDRIGLEDWDFWVGAVGAGATVTPVDGCWLEYRRSSSGTRNSITRGAALRAHLRVFRRHREVRLWHLGRWALRSAARNAKRLR